jgi:hypothetical protein
MKRPRFYTSYAGHEHFAPIVQVTPEHLRSWWYEFSQVCGDYDVYFVGSLAQKMFGEYTGNVNDLDIVLTGPVGDLDKLKDILRDAVYLGFKQNIFCDIKYQSPLILPWDKFEPFVVIKPSTTLVHMVNNQITQRRLVNTEYIQLPNGLCQQHYTSPPKYHEKFEFKAKRHGYQPIIKKLKKNLEM